MISPRDGVDWVENTAKEQVLFLQLLSLERILAVLSLCASQAAISSLKRPKKPSN